MKKIFLSLSLLAAVLLQSVNAQMSVGTSAAPNANAVLDLVSSNQGLLLPRVALSSTTSASPLSAHVAGMHVYNTATAGTYPNNVTPGEYYNNGTKWQKLLSESDLVVSVAALGSGANVSNNNTWVYSGTSLTLPPGKWQVNVTVLLVSSDGSNVRTLNSNEFWWVWASFSDSSTTLAQSADLTSNAQAVGSITSNSSQGLLTGSMVLNNRTGGNKTYYFMGKIASSNNAIAGSILSKFCWSNNGENIITYQRIY